MFLDQVVGLAHNSWKWSRDTRTTIDRPQRVIFGENVFSNIDLYCYSACLGVASTLKFPKKFLMTWSIVHTYIQCYFDHEMSISLQVYTTVTRSHLFAKLHRLGRHLHSNNRNYAVFAISDKLSSLAGLEFSDRCYTGLCFREATANSFCGRESGEIMANHEHGSDGAF